jgi:hypothetical protein
MFVSYNDAKPVDAATNPDTLSDEDNYSCSETEPRAGDYLETGNRGILKQQ